jgi:hypothetical protein
MVPFEFEILVAFIKEDIEREIEEAEKRKSKG